jgi:hypothetical protein
LEILDVTVVTVLVPESGLAINRGAVADIALTEDSRIGLCQVLWALDVRVSF